MTKLILATASVFALAIGGAGVSFAGNAGNTIQNAGMNMPAMPGTSQTGQNAVNPSANWKSSQQEIRQVQEQLQGQGLYHGKIDGVLGPETKQALQQFQQKNGLRVTATLDQPTMDKLLGALPVGQGSSMPPSNLGQPTGATANPNAAVPPSNLGDHGAMKH
jgi:peptidoglycan hydrolase-like protein with peptidoglycan-binding domain